MGKVRGMTCTAESVRALMTCAVCGELSPGVCPTCGSVRKKKCQTRRVVGDAVYRKLLKLVPEHVAPDVCEAMGITWQETLDDMWDVYALAADDALDDTIKGPSGYTAVDLKRELWKLPLCQTGDILYAKEAYRVGDHDMDEPPSAWLIEYAADGRQDWILIPPEYDTAYAQKRLDVWCGGDVDVIPDSRLRPARFMPAWAARIRRTCTAVRAERLNEISRQDANAEGIGVEVSNTFGPGLALPQPELVYYDPGQQNRGYATAREAYQAWWKRLHNHRGKPAIDNPLVFVYEMKVAARPEEETRDVRHNV